MSLRFLGETERGFFIPREAPYLEPEQWPWSSFRYYAYDEPGPVLVNEQRPAQLRMRSPQSGSEAFGQKGWGDQPAHARPRKKRKSSPESFPGPQSRRAQSIALRKSTGAILHKVDHSHSTAYRPWRPPCEQSDLGRRKPFDASFADCCYFLVAQPVHSASGRIRIDSKGTANPHCGAQRQ